MDDGKYNDSRVFFVFFCGQPLQSVYHCHLVGWGDGTRILNAICSTGCEGQHGGIYGLKYFVLVNKDLYVCKKDLYV